MDMNDDIANIDETDNGNDDTNTNDGEDDVAHDVDAFFPDETDTNDDTEADTETADVSDNEDNDDDDRVSDLSAAILGSKSENNGELNTNSNDADMEYYVKITLINMWLILGLIVVVNICFYWCYCRKTQRKNKGGIMKNNVFTGNNSSDAIGGLSEEDLA